MVFALGVDRRGQETQSRCSRHSERTTMGFVQKDIVTSSQAVEKKNEEALRKREAMRPGSCAEAGQASSTIPHNRTGQCLLLFPVPSTQSHPRQTCLQFQSFGPSPPNHSTIKASELLSSKQSCHTSNQSTQAKSTG